MCPSSGPSRQGPGAPAGAWLALIQVPTSRVWVWGGVIETPMGLEALDLSFGAASPPHPESWHIHCPLEKLGIKTGLSTLLFQRDEADKGL